MAKKNKGKMSVESAGRKGGKAWAANRTPEERKEQARKAAEARWGTKKPKRSGT